MRKTELLAIVTLCALQAIQLAQPAAAGDIGSKAPALPSYSREEVARTCLNEYGMGNSSLIDCLSTDEKVKTSLSRRWPDTADRPKSDCLVRLAGESITSYAHLDSCTKAFRRDAEGVD